MLGRLQLPSSLLPAENLLDFSHYRETFSQIVAGLKAFPQDAACAQTLETLTGNARLCLGALAGFGAILVLLLILSFALKHRKPPAGRHFSQRVNSHTQKKPRLRPGGFSHGFFGSRREGRGAGPAAGTS